MRVQSLIEALENGTIAAESGGNPNALHPLVKRGQYAGQRAIGLFGIMPGNVPGWSREHLGRVMTPEELAQDTEAQRRIFRGEMQKNLAKHGTPQDAASVWFTGRPYAQAARAGANDSFTSVQDYVAKVTGSAPSLREGAAVAPPTATGETMAALPPPPFMASMGGLGGLGGTLQAIGMSLLSSPSHSPFQALPEAMQVMAKNKAAEALQSYNMQKDERDFGLRREDLQARRAESAIDNARQERALTIQEQNAKRTGLGTTGALMQSMYPDLDPVRDREEYLKRYKELAQSGNSDEIFGTTPQTGYDKEGKPVQYVIGNRGTVKPISGGEGVTPSAKAKTVKTATELLTLDQNGAVIKREPLGLAEAESQKAQGMISGQRIAGAPGDIKAADIALDVLDQIEKHPGREWGVGATANLWSPPNTDKRGFDALVRQGKATAFAQGIQVLRGMGALSNAEGQAATEAIARMDQATKKDDFAKAISDYRKIVQAGRDYALQLQAGRVQPKDLPGAGAIEGSALPVVPPAAGNRMRFDASGRRIQ